MVVKREQQVTVGGVGLVFPKHAFALNWLTRFSLLFRVCVCVGGGLRGNKNLCLNFVLAFTHPSRKRLLIIIISSIFQPTNEIIHYIFSHLIRALLLSQFDLFPGLF